MAYEPKTWVKGETVTPLALNNVENAIVEVDGDYVPHEWQCGEVVTADLLNHIEQGIANAGSNESKPLSDINFIDYDGNIVQSYTKDEFLAMSAMPDAPSHSGLTAQGWNWSLADAQAYVAKYGRLNVGQMYVTTSGDTEIDIKLDPGWNKPYLGCCPNGTVDIDWGDGSAHDTLTGTSTDVLKSVQHIYPDTGEAFTIKLHMESGTLGFIGDSSSSTGSQVLYNGTTGTLNGQRAYQSSIQAIRFGNHVTSIGNYAFEYCYSLTSVTMPTSVANIGESAFAYCYALASVTIPEGITKIGFGAFQYCYALSSISIPKSVTSIENSAFNSCYALASVIIPEGVTEIGSGVFQYCYALTSITIPEGVTSIGYNTLQRCHRLLSVTIPESVTSIASNAFNDCSGLLSLVFEGATPPSVMSANAFGNLPSNLIVYVPVGMLSVYRDATNYSDIANNMVEMAA